MSAATNSELFEPNKVYVQNLRSRVTSQDLKRHFNEIVPVTQAIVIQDKFTGRSKGFGFVTCRDKADVDK